MSKGFFFRDDENVLLLDSGSGCTTLFNILKKKNH
jgi:hypothetical protein